MYKLTHKIVEFIGWTAIITGIMLVMESYVYIDALSKVLIKIPLTLLAVLIWLH